MKLPGSTSKVTTLFVGKSSQAVDVIGKVDIILLPSLYWLKIEELPIKSVAQAQKLAPSLFDGSIAEGEYSYQAVKKEGLYWLFAYSNTLIAEALDVMGIKPSQIHSVYFAQNECQEVESFLKVSESMALTCKDEVVSLVPLSYVPDATASEAFLSSYMHSKHKVSLNLYQNTFLSDKEISRLSIVAIMFILIYLGAYYIAKQDYKELRIQEYAMNKKYDLPKTSFQLKSLKRSLEKKQAHEYLLRNTFKTLTKIPLQKGEYIKKIAIDAKKMTLEIHMLNAKNAEKIKKYVQKSMKITRAKVVDTLFYLGVSYE